MHRPRCSACAANAQDHERELVSQLISNLYDGAVSPHEIARGFEILISRIDDLTIDNPQAPTLLAAFLVRAVVDDVLPPAFVRQNPPEPLTTDLQLATLTQAKAQLAVSHFGDRRRKVWGAAADADVATLKHSVSELVREYLVGGDLNEAVRCLVELNAPSFYHEVVKRLVVLSLDHNSTEQQLARRLVGRLYGDRLLTEEQLLLGCKRLLEALPDLRLDNPKASEVLSEFFDSCCELDALAPSEDWREVCPDVTAHGARDRAPTCTLLPVLFSPEFLLPEGDPGVTFWRRGRCSSFSRQRGRVEVTWM